jgi:uncharacterized protein YjiS (DUF1127 family)
MSIKEIFRRWRRYRQIVRELECYSHQELTELGIAPADIGRIAEMTASQEAVAGKSADAQNIVPICFRIEPLLSSTDQLGEPT